MPCPARDWANFHNSYKIDNSSHSFFLGIILWVLIGLKFSLPTNFIVEQDGRNICSLAHHSQSFCGKSGRKCVSEALEEDRQQILI